MTPMRAIMVAPFEFDDREQGFDRGYLRGQVAACRQHAKR